ncbi:MAG: copper resistance protein [Rhodospirillales bacterium 20-64-7]|nr:MAG: copper resistance protein [Rhodospirillales bacterium 20-64-7]
MRKFLSVSITGTCLVLASVAAYAHGGDEFSAGVPGNPAKPSRKIEIVMTDADGNMSLSPNKVEVKKGEQVEFIIKNKGALRHEFTLASVKDNEEHEKMMMKFPDMEHDDPNAKTLEPGKSAEILWRFTKPGTFEFACLIPGHKEAGMRGTVTVR